MPLFTPPPTSSAQTIYTPLAVDTTTTSTTYVNLITQNIIIQEESYLLVRASFSTSDSSSASGQNYFRITVDNIDYVYAGAEIFTCIQSGSIVAKVGPLPVGDHIINLDWQTAVGNTLRCRPVTQNEQASIVTTEVTDGVD
jgi:hypothetical protein